MGRWEDGKMGILGKNAFSFPSFPCHLLEVNICQISCHLEEGGDSDSSLVAFHAVVVESVAFPSVVVGVHLREAVENLSASLSESVGKCKGKSQPVVVALCSGYSSGLKILPLNRNRRMRNRMCGGVKGR